MKYYVRPDGLHEASRIINGKRKVFRGKTDAEVNKKIRAYKARIERGMLFSEVLDDWKDVTFPDIAYSTVQGYKAAVRRLPARMLSTPIKSLTTKDINAYLRTLAEKKYARKSVAASRSIINMVCVHALRLGEIDVNPCAAAVTPKHLPQTRREAASPEDEEKIKKNVDKWLLPYFVLYTGLRKGEALALKWGDVDFVNDIITVNKAVYFESEVPHIKRPKTDAGVRTVPLLAPLKKVLRPRAKDKYIFSVDGKTPYDKSEYQVLMEHYQKETGITCTLHQLRHSYATMLFECDISPKDAQALLGHSNIVVTEDIYTHIRQSRQKVIAATINERLKNT